MPKYVYLLAISKVIGEGKLVLDSSKKPPDRLTGATWEEKTWLKVRSFYTVVHEGTKGQNQSL